MNPKNATVARRLPWQRLPLASSPNYNRGRITFVIFLFYFYKRLAKTSVSRENVSGSVCIIVVT